MFCEEVSLLVNYCHRINVQRKSHWTRNEGIECHKERMFVLKSFLIYFFLSLKCKHNKEVSKFEINSNKCAVWRACNSSINKQFPEMASRFQKKTHFVSIGLRFFERLMNDLWEGIYLRVAQQLPILWTTTKKKKQQLTTEWKKLMIKDGTKETKRN